MVALATWTDDVLAQHMSSVQPVAERQHILQGAGGTFRLPPSGNWSHSMGSMPPAPASEAGSGDSLGSSKVARTRRGKRAGKHQRQRQSLDESRRSMDLQAAVPAASSEAESAAAAAMARPSRLSLDSQAAVRGCLVCSVCQQQVVISSALC